MNVDDAFLLDTHVWLWMSLHTEKIKARQRELLIAAGMRNRLYISAISLLEVANLVRKNKIDLSMSLQPWFDMVLSEPGLPIAPITPEVAVATTNLPDDFHGDPCDRLIAATAMARKMTLCTHDDLLVRFGQQGHYRFLKI